MAIDPGIIQGLRPVQLPDSMNMLAQAMQVRSAQNQDALSQYGLAKAQRQDAESNALARLLSGGGVDANTPEGQAKLYSVAPTQAGTYIKNMLESRNIQSQIGERDSKAATEAQNRALQGYGQFQKVVGAHINNPNTNAQAVANSVQGLVQANVMDGKVAQSLLSEMPQDPAQLRPYLQQVVAAQLTPEQQLTVFAPKPTEVNTGQTKVFRDMNPNSQTYGQNTGGAPVQLQATPGEMLSSNTSRANNRDTIAAENLRAGITPDGSISPDMETTARAIASGQLPPPSGMALTNPKNQRILSRVMEINPQYDFTNVTAKKTAAAAFTTGKEGAMMRSLQVAGQHLDQLGELADAMNNGSVQLVNKIGNTLSQQTGSPAITNFDAAKEVVAKEVMKSIVVGGGGVGEREELAKTLSNAKSPAQLRGVITQYRNLMAAQHDALLQQRRAAGLSDTTLPNYTEGGGAPGIPSASAIDAELLRRGVK